MTALALSNLKYIGQGPTVGGQALADQTSGPKAKTLYAYGTIVNDSTASATNAPVGFIDGVQSLGRVVTMHFQAATAAATIGGVVNQTVYSSTGPDSQVPVGTSIVMAGFANGGNNGTFTVTGNSSQNITVTNSGGVAEPNPGGVGTYTIGGIPVSVSLFIAGTSTDSAAAVILAAAKPLYATALSATGFTINFSTLTTSGATVTYGAVIVFGS